MRTLRLEVLSGQRLAGVWCNLGSAYTAEIAARAGFDWVLIDAEHGPGDHAVTLQQVQAVKHLPCAPIVRIAANVPHLFKRALDAGAAGIMVPQVRSAEEARRAVASMRYPPNGVRGVSRVNLATCFGMDFDTYREETERHLVTIIQIETAEALTSVNEIAAIDGVDVLFIGPLDLSYALGIPGDCRHPRFAEAKEQVLSACRESGKAAGILLGAPADVCACTEAGFTFVALGCDAAMVVQGMLKALTALKTEGRSTST